MQNGAPKKNEWIYSFAITETAHHKKGFTIYKITSIVIPRNVPEALSCVTVWKRFREIKMLHKDLQKKAKELKIHAAAPELKASYFKRFHPATIDERKAFIITLLNYAADNPGLFRSEPFVKFFETSVDLDVVDKSPLHEKRKEDADKNEDETTSNEFTKDPIEAIHEKLFQSHGASGDDASASNDFLARLTEEVKLDERLEDARITDIERRLKALSDYAHVDYLYEAALKFTEAVEAESTAQYVKAFDAYKAGIDILLTGVKTDKDAERKKIVKDKVAKYLQRAEDIYENFVLKQKDEEPLMLVSSKSGDRDFVEITTNIERPLNYLSRFKVLKTIDGLQQIQDVTDKKVYMLKVIPKPHSMKASRMIYLPQESSYMVPLVSYCQTSDSIFLIMKLICGGKLWNYIQSYKSMDSQSSRTSEAQLFVEPKMNLVSSTDQVDSTNVIPQKVEVTDLLDSSQKLLQSISATLEKSKDISVAEETDIDSDLDEGSIEEILKDIMGEGTLKKLNEVEDENTIVKRILLEVEQEAAEDLKEIGYEADKDLPPKQSEVNDILDEIESDVQLEEILNEIPQVPEEDLSSISLETLQLPTVESIKVPDVQSSEIGKENIIASPLPIRLLPELTVVRYCAELVCAVEEFHSSGIVCGDLNLNNVLLGPKGQLILTYFYRNESHLAIPNEEAVEKFYVAPERPLTKNSDWWSVGVIMFELLVERRFYLCHPGKVEFYVELQIPEDVLISEEARDLLEHMIEPNPDTRYNFQQISSHVFFKSINWDEIRENGKLTA